MHVYMFVHVCLYVHMYICMCVCVCVCECVATWKVCVKCMRMYGSSTSFPIPLQTLSNISTLLERANSVYEQLVDRRHLLDKLLSQVSSSSDSLPTSSHPVLALIPSGPRGSSARYIMVSEGHPASGGSEGMVNKSIQVSYGYSTQHQSDTRVHFSISVIHSMDSTDT